MPSLPPLLQWITLVGVVIALAKDIVELFLNWHNRQRIRFRVLSATTYFEKWAQSDVDAFIPSSTWPDPRIRIGEFRWLFTVLEFSIENLYPNAVSVGRFLINDWINSDKYVTPGPTLSYKERNYRVFDLHTKEPRNLESYELLEPGDSLAVRVEILEEAFGPQVGRIRDVYNLPLTHYQIQYQTSVGTFKKKIEPVKQPRPSRLYRWSDLIESSLLSDGWPPQGVNAWPTADAYRKHWIQSKANLLLYGTVHHVPGQRNRLSNLLRKKNRGRG